MKSDLERGIVVTDKVVDIDEEDNVFGKRWGSQTFCLTEDDIDILRQGKHLALDIQEEYIAYLKLVSKTEEHND